MLKLETLLFYMKSPKIVTSLRKFFSVLYIFFDSWPTTLSSQSKTWIIRKRKLNSKLWKSAMVTPLFLPFGVVNFIVFQKCIVMLGFRKKKRNRGENCEESHAIRYILFVNIWCPPRLSKWKVHPSFPAFRDKNLPFTKCKCKSEWRGCDNCTQSSYLESECPINHFGIKTN